MHKRTKGRGGAWKKDRESVGVGRDEGVINYNTFTYLRTKSRYYTLLDQIIQPETAIANST